MHDITRTSIEIASAGLLDDETGHDVHPDPEPWTTQALCAQTDPELFYPEKETGQLTTAAAKRVCASCPVRVQCLEDALARLEPHGIWGGKTTTERAAIRRERRSLAQEVAA